MRRPTRRALAAVAAALLLSACGGELPRDAVATVDGEAIAAAELETWVRAAIDANPALDEVAVQRDLLARMIQRRIVAGLAADLGLEVPETAVADIATRVEAQLGGAEALEATLAEVGFPRSFYEEVFLVTEATLDTIAADLVGDRVIETRTARHILVETQAEADEIVALLAEGADFATLASERSTVPGSAAQGGLLGARERGVFVPAFDEAVWSARLGVVLAPVQSDFGFHVIEVVEEATTPATELSAGEQRDLAGAAFDTLLGDAVQAAEVVVVSRLGEWDATSGLIVAPTTVGAGRW